ncbi:MAG: ribonuclease E inhibitor RraB [Gillisia sp.]
MNRFLSFFDIFQNLKRKLQKKNSSATKESKLVPATIKELSKKGIKKGDTVPIRFLFMGRNKKDVQKIFRTLLHDFNYQNINSSPIEDQWVISGWTEPQLISRTSLVKWEKEMKNLARTCNLEFVGWGVNTG